MKNQKPDRPNAVGAVLLLALCWCALAKCVFGMLAYLPALSWKDIGPLAVLSSLSASAAWMSRPGLAWPDYAAVFALIGAAYAEGPIQRMRWGDAPDIEGFLPFALWLVVLDRDWSRSALYWLWPLTGCALAVGFLGLFDGEPSAWLRAPWLWRAGLILPAIVVLAARLHRERRLLTTELTFLVIGVTPATLWTVAELLLPRVWPPASPVPKLGVNLWLATIPLGLTAMYQYRRRHQNEPHRNRLDHTDLSRKGE